jgi:hypothetical protein
VYDSLIRGQQGKVLVQVDARKQAFLRVERPPTSGAVLELTIDQNIQHLVERELKAGVDWANAAGGSAIVMDPATGEVLAMASYPTFNPTSTAKRRRTTGATGRCRICTSPDRPFKIITASAALEEHVVKPTDLVDVSSGTISFGSRTIRDDHHYGVLTFQQVVEKVEQRGSIKVGLRLGSERFGGYVKRFGFGRMLSPDFRGENAGIVWNWSTLTQSALASTLIGYQIGVTPLQMVTAVSAVANGGELIQPRVVRAVVQGRAALPGAAQGPRPRDQQGHGGPADADARRRRHRRHRQAGGDCRLHNRRQDRHRQEARQRQLPAATRTTTSRSSASRRRASRSSRSSSSWTRRTACPPTAARWRARSSSRHCDQRCATTVCSGRSTRRRAHRERRRPNAQRRRRPGVGAGQPPSVLSGATADPCARTSRHERARPRAHARDVGLPVQGLGHGLVTDQRRCPGPGVAACRRALARSPAPRLCQSARSMTVRDVLVDRVAVLVAPARALDAPGLDVPCTGVVVRLTLVSPGPCSSRCRGCAPMARRSRRRRWRPARAVSWPPLGVPPVAGAAWLPVGDPRLALALLAAEFHGTRAARCAWSASPARTARRPPRYLVRAILEAAGIKCGLMGTVAYCIGDREIEASRTTPEAPDVQRFLREMLDEACGACVMEVSSHALALRRVDGLQFAAGVFTNLTRDHLDFHGSMESYFVAKRRLFEMLPSTAPAVVNLDDPRGAALVGVAGTPVTYAIGKAADVTTGTAVVLASRTRVRRPHAAGRSAREVAARRQAERLQHPLRRGRDGRDGHSARCESRKGSRG